ncbi:MAG: hypothetical protein JW839_04825 [Candidatus Lokiarchaeota archaeon]|nr:hypothetical protein [Candidatus Lokiarchaeota archaeon]
MTETTQGVPKDAWKNLVKRHWKMSAVIVAGVVGAVIGAILVFLWRTIGPEALARYPSTLDLWAVGYVVSLLLDLLLWEILLVVLPVIAAAIAVYFLWWNKIPEAERQEYASATKDGKPQKKVKKGGAGGVLNFLVAITWLIVVHADGKWDAAFGSWTFTYLVTSVLTAFLWDLVIIGIPATIALIWWIVRELKK